MSQITHYPDDSRAVCNQCGEEYGTDELLPVDNLLERVYAGEEMPAGECPDCGACCYLIRELRTFEVDAQAMRDLIQAARSAMAERRWKVDRCQESDEWLIGYNDAMSDALMIYLGVDPYQKPIHLELPE